MRTVRDTRGKRYVLLKESEDASLVRDPETGERRHFPTAELEVVAGESPLATAARGVSEPVRVVLTAVPDERALGLLLEIEARGAVGVRELLEATDLCESDLHGLLAEFRAAGLVEETRLGDQRGYEATGTAERGLAAVQGADG